jgi:hypothetical protein
LTSSVSEQALILPQEETHLLQPEFWTSRPDDGLCDDLPVSRKVTLGAGWVLTDDAIQNADIKNLAIGLARNRPGRIFLSYLTEPGGLRNPAAGRKMEALERCILAAAPSDYARQRC